MCFVEEKVSVLTNCLGSTHANLLSEELQTHESIQMEGISVTSYKPAPLLRKFLKDHMQMCLRKPKKKSTLVCQLSNVLQKGMAVSHLLFRIKQAIKASYI